LSILRRVGQFSEVVREWQGETVVLIGGGPSLTQDQVGMVRVSHKATEVRCIAVNDAYLWAPFADVCYFADMHWFKWQTDGVAKPLLGLTADQVRERFASFAGQKCSIDNNGVFVKDPAVHVLRQAKGGCYGLSLDPCRVVTGRNSGYQALNMAVLSGAKTVILIGYDAQVPKNGPSHFFGEHPTTAPAAVVSEYRTSFRMGADAIKAAGVRVINASPGSAVDAFEKADLAEALRLQPDPKPADLQEASV
jgi:hypothetical protein